MPTRLVEILLTEKGHAQWRLRSVTNDLILGGKYLTVSHRWGTSQHLQLTKATFSALEEGKALCELPPKYRDAFTVARHLSVKLVWIDSLCIIQDLKEDWLHEASQMRDVYANAMCNIAIALDYHEDSEYFSTRLATALKPIFIHPQWIPNLVQEYILYELDLWNTEVHSSKLNYRGWLLQERFLAPCLLYLTKQQLFWESGEVAACEMYPNGKPCGLTKSSGHKCLNQLLAQGSEDDSAVLNA